MQPVRTAETSQLLAELTQPIGREDPYPRYRTLREQAPVALAEDDAIVLTRYADCQAVLQDHSFGRPDIDEAFTSMGLPGWRDMAALYTLNTSMLTLNPPDHTRLRRLVNRAFTPRTVQRLNPSVHDLVDSLLEELDGGADFVDTFAFPLPVGIIGELLGVPDADRAAFQPLVRDWTMILDVYDLGVLDRANRAAAQIRTYLADLAEERRRTPQDDLISSMVTVTGDDGAVLDEDEVVTMAALLFSAGFETTTHLLGNGLVALLDNPEQAETLRISPDLAATALDELIRFDSSVQITSRVALADTDVAGFPVTKGSRLICYLGAANRDPDKFTDPERLDLTRREGAPMSFGGGIHYCLGAPLARLETQVAFPALLNRYPKLQVAEGAERRASLTLRGYTKLPIIC